MQPSQESTAKSALSREPVVALAIAKAQRSFKRWFEIMTAEARSRPEGARPVLGRLAAAVRVPRGRRWRTGVPDEAEQAAIAKAKRMRGRGNSLRHIAGKLAFDGHKLNPESVRRMLAR